MGAEKGVSFKPKGSFFSDHKLYFTRVGHEELGFLGFRKGEFFGIGREIDDGDVHAELFVRRLPPGQYAFVGAEFWANHGLQGTSTGRYKLERPVVFTVAPRRATYIGSFIASTEWAYGLKHLGRWPLRGYFRVTNEAQRDVPLLRAVPELPAEIFVDAVDPGDDNPPLLKAFLPVRYD